MKNLSLIINAVLLAAVGVLYYLHFATGTAKTGYYPDSLVRLPSASLVFVNIDTLLNNYDYFKDLQGEMQDKQSELEAELNTKSKSYEQRALDYQNKVNKGLVTRREAAEIEQSLLEEQQSLLQLRDDLSLQLTEEEQVRHRRLLDNIMAFLKEYNMNYNYQIIFSNSFGGSLLFANDSLDITHSVLEGINKKYHEETEENK